MVQLNRPATKAKASPNAWSKRMQLNFEDNANAEFRAMLRAYDRRSEIVRAPTVSVVMDSIASDQKMIQKVVEMLGRHSDNGNGPSLEKAGPFEIGYALVLRTEKQCRELLNIMHLEVSGVWSETVDGFSVGTPVSDGLGRAIIEPKLIEYVGGYYKILRAAIAGFRGSTFLNEVTGTAGIARDSGIALAASLKGAAAGCMRIISPEDGSEN